LNMGAIYMGAIYLIGLRKQTISST